MTITPVFIHINKSSGRYLRQKLCEDYNDNFYVHHVNPQLWRDNVPRNKVIRFWKYRNPLMSYSTPMIRVSNSTVLDLSENIRIFSIIRNPVHRYISENFYHIKDLTLEDPSIINTLDDNRSCNIMCKSILIAFTKNVDLLFQDFTEINFEDLINFIENNNVKIFNLDDNNNYKDIQNYLNLSTPIKSEINNKYNNLSSQIKDLIEKKNNWDVKLYQKYK